MEAGLILILLVANLANLALLVWLLVRPQAESAGLPDKTRLELLAGMAAGHDKVERLGR